MYETYAKQYLAETIRIAQDIDTVQIGKCAEILKDTRDNAGRLFILGVGGSAANASHAVNDFRKIGGIETYAPTDNVSELTARTNDEGWETTFIEWLKVSHLSSKDVLMVLSVGGGSEHTSLNIVNALKYGREQGCRIISIVSRDGGYSKKISDACVLIPVVADTRITPHAEGWQGVIWHLLVNAIGSAQE
ncbi:MAG: SIS domain-containing protein [Clostridium sp.]|nr:SIS domain-containing protein [Ruminococcus flavefaciens]MCM1499466.1 SIS domain-containing protein [Clostridium sp.]